LDKTSRGKTLVENIRTGKNTCFLFSDFSSEVAEVESSLKLRSYTDNVEKKNGRKC